MLTMKEVNGVCIGRLNREKAKDPVNAKQVVLKLLKPFGVKKLADLKESQYGPVIQVMEGDVMGSKKKASKKAPAKKAAPKVKAKKVQPKAKVKAAPKAKAKVSGRKKLPLSQKAILRSYKFKPDVLKGIEALAKRYTKGNVTLWLTTAGLKYRPIVKKKA